MNDRVAPQGSLGQIIFVRKSCRSLFLLLHQKKVISQIRVWRAINKKGPEQPVIDEEPSHYNFETQDLFRGETGNFLIVN